MQDSEVINERVCLLCCEQREIFILPKCNHKQICWRCCINMIKEGNFGCPFCKSSVNEKEKIIFVTRQEMRRYSYQDVLKSHVIDLLKSSKNSNFYYSNQHVALKIQYQTSYNCPFQQCQQLFDSLNQIKKHLDLKHKKMYCDICLNNRKCIHSEQVLYSQASYQRHIKQGQFSQHGDLILFHPTCAFCRQLFYDIDEFRRHLQRDHEKCYICHKSSEEFKYVYFKDYDQAKQHFKKSHFYCQISTCMTTKFQNVFVTQDALNEHIHRVHRKAKNNPDNKPIMNIVLGFNQSQKQSLLQWDKIGNNFASIFQMVQKSSSSVKLQPVDHEDSKIDIRDFYPEQWKKTLHWSFQKVKQKIQDKMFENKYKDVDLFIDDVDFFRPLDMQPTTRVQLQRFLTSIFDRKISQPIISKFFAGRQDFSSADQYFGFVRDKMRSYSKIAFYYAFPQLVRFFKNDNPHKQLMDEYYYENLRALKVKKPFVIHTKDKYSEIFEFMKYLIEKEVEERDEDLINSSAKELDIEKYLSFMQDSSLTYYIKHQEDIFYVSKQKITNLYHMINKCKVQDFLKMNWLLKIGFNNEAYKIISKQFYYKQQFDCHHAIKKLNIQELAYLYAYCTICVQAIFHKNIFKAHKEKPLPLFVTDILTKIKRSSTHQRLQQIIQTQNKFLKADHLTHHSKDKGIIINVQDHPSLLDRSIDVVPFRSKPPDLQKNHQNHGFPLIPSFGTVLPKSWNQPTGTATKNINKNGKIIEQYPSILSDTAKNKKIEKKTQEEQFPVFHYVGKKQKKDKTANKGLTLNEAIGWGNSSFASSKWNQETSLKNWQKRQEDERRRIQRHQQIQNQTLHQQQKIQQKIPKKPKHEESSGKKQKPQKEQLKPEPPKPQAKPVQPMVFVMSKKAQKIDELDPSFQVKKKNKQKKNQEAEEKKFEPQKKLEDDACGLFEKIEKESQIISKKNKPKHTKLDNFFDSSPVAKKQQKQKIPSKTSYMHSSYVEFDNGDFPQLAVKKPEKNQLKPKEIIVKPEEQNAEKKKRKKMADDTSSEEEKPSQKQDKIFDKRTEIKGKNGSKKDNQKQQQEFSSLMGRFQQQKEQKMSMVNQIIHSAKVEEKPENIIKVKKGKKGKKEIIERVNLANLWG